MEWDCAMMSYFQDGYHDVHPPLTAAYASASTCCR